jgi:predicted TIM-barrel enzyme
VLVGSGLDRCNAAGLLAVSDGAIVGTSLLRGGHAALELVDELVRAAGRARAPA